MSNVKTNTNWILWHHNPIDKQWGLDSYNQLYEIKTISDFWLIYNNWDKYLPPVYDGMYFLMRNTSQGVIYPLWEDKQNCKGGYWSFKVGKENSKELWEKLSIHMIGEQMVDNIDHSLIINGISISPKKNFCVIKIWNNDSVNSDISILKNNICDLNFEEAIYKKHSINIANDTFKKNKHRRS